MDDPHRSSSRKHLTIAAVLALAGALAACDLDAMSGNGADGGVFYALGDDHRLYRWDPGADSGDGDAADVEPVLDLSGVWDAEGDVGTVLRASLSVDPTGRHAAWVAGASPHASLMFGDLDTGEVATAIEYPVDHACIDPVWLPDGSAVLAHRAPVWGTATAAGDEIPFPVTTWGATEWHSPDAGRLPTTVELTPHGCRLRWYTAEDGSAQALYHDLELSELYRIDTNGHVLETIPVSNLEGAEPLTIGLVNVDPAGRYACVVEDYGPDGAVKGGFTIRAESGTRVVDLASGEAVGPDESGCTTLHEDGFVSRTDATVDFIGYDGEHRWTIELPGPIAESPVLYFVPGGS
ncbi:hypothetical protein [Glycomyces tritici]|uniref:Ig-like domain-containing protein n=1 Tax=Glycomyces tritici TaxID=2665176 RepID=A0ABT7YXA8_9ACTN|nr:hypothetical protein [Glycomyces tritici]MDN3241254.1 hypothetical protein [Glycomyces tritici]MDN3243277.1 hypothetical protein [Glycomyces tritici]